MATCIRRTVRCSGPTAASPTYRNGSTCSDLDRTVADSLAEFAPSLTHTRRMHLLAQFLFRGDAIRAPGGGTVGW